LYASSPSKKCLKRDGIASNQGIEFGLVVPLQNIPLDHKAAASRPGRFAPGTVRFTAITIVRGASSNLFDNLVSSLFNATAQADLQCIADSIPFRVRALFSRLGNDLLLATFRRSLRTEDIQ
jgi:hypothetical protein